MEFTPSSRQDWRNWLSQNHETSDEVWLVFFKKSTGKSTLPYNDAVEEALCFGWIDGKKRGLDQERYAFRFTPRKPDSLWSSSNKQRVEKLLEQGAMTPAGRQCVEKARETGVWDRIPDTERSYSMPAELLEALERSPKAREFFDSLAPSYRKKYITWVASAKREATRLRRAEEASSLLSQNKKLGMK